MRTMQHRAADDPVGRMGLAGTALVHGLAVLLLVFAGREAVRRSPLPAYRVELVAAPTSGSDAPPAATAPAPASTPTPAPATPVRAPKPTPVRAPVARQPAPAAPVRTPAAPAAHPTTPTPTPGPPMANTNAAPSTGTDAATIRTEGVEFPFPGYLRNLVAQVYRRWRPPGGNTDLEAEMIFFVHRDGSVTGLQFVKRSGSFAFDLEAQGAVEASARAGAFGALPVGYGPDMLPVSFFFSPRSLR